jgi:S-adenosylmethionine decarboxylase
MSGYNPGLHLLCTFSAAGDVLNAPDCCAHVFNELIGKLALQKVGEVYHQFPGGGFTAVVCLTESHVSIHTWPEFGVATFDVFLSNFERDNSEKVRRFFDSAIQSFEATIISKQEITR